MNYRIVTNGELSHHGILGMHWGVRRYQRKDGSLTPAGRKRYRITVDDPDELKTAVDRMRLEKKYVDTASQPGDGRVSKRLNTIGNVAAATAAGVKLYDVVGSNLVKDKDKFNSGKEARSKATKLLAEVGVVTKAGSKIMDINDKRNLSKDKKSRAKEARYMTDEELKDITNRIDLNNQYRNLSKEYMEYGKSSISDSAEIFKNIATIGVASVAGYAIVKGILDSKSTSSGSGSGKGKSKPKGKGK